jgi:hypothetical protein
MKTTKQSIIILMSMVLLITVSCDDYLDVNVNPNVPSGVPENIILSGVLSRHSYLVIGNWPARHPAKWLQQIAWNGVPPTWDNYDVTESDANAAWLYSYADVIKNAMELNRMASERGNYAYAGIAKTIIAWNFSILTDLFGDIPYTDALDPASHMSPSYDSQEDIYIAIFQWLDEAIEDFDRPSPLRPVAFDLLYGGDMERWKRLAYTLKARYHLRLSGAPGNSPNARAQQALDVLANGFTSNNDNAKFAYSTEPGAENPWHQFAILGNWDDRDQMAHNYIELLKSLNDPRLPIQARPVESSLPDSIVYIGHRNGEDGIGSSNVSRIGHFYSDADADLTLLHFAEAKFIEAEARLILNGAGTADPVYRDAIRAHMDDLGISQDDREAYLNTLPSLAAADNPLKEIMAQKYIANFLNPEIYNDWRRTRYPELSPVTNAPRIAEIPKRFPYPLSEWQYNASNVSATGIPLGYSSMTFQVWWDQN